MIATLSIYHTRHSSFKYFHDTSGARKIYKIMITRNDSPRHPSIFFSYTEIPVMQRIDNNGGICTRAFLFLRRNWWKCKDFSATCGQYLVSLRIAFIKICRKKNCNAFEKHYFITWIRFLFCLGLIANSLGAARDTRYKWYNVSLTYRAKLTLILATVRFRLFSNTTRIPSPPHCSTWTMGIRRSVSRGQGRTNNVCPATSFVQA